MNSRLRLVVPFAAVASLAVLTALPAVGSSRASTALGGINHIVVIYQENHSFDNLYGSWERVNGLSHASPANTLQIKQDGSVFACLMQNDSHLTSPPLTATCTDTTGTPGSTNQRFSSAFVNAAFGLDNYAANNAATEDLVHRYYQEQYQINGGQQNRYVQGSDAIGLSMGQYDTTQLPIYQYLHQAGHPAYAISDKFFQGSFGGSFLNHQWLIAAATPVFAGAPNDGSANDRHSVVDTNGMPANYPLYKSPLGSQVKDFNITASCNPPAGRPATPAGVVCGDYAVNTTQPTFQPYAPGTPAARRLPPLTTNNIGDELTASGVDWAWYAGGWDNAAGNSASPYYTNGAGPNCADPNTIAAATYPYCANYLFQFHHQPFNYFANYGPNTAGRSHLQDEQAFLGLANGSSATSCKLKPVSFVKPIGQENEHPGYTNESEGSKHLVSLLKAIEGSACAKDTLVVTTYDEFGGFWDHVAPPSPTNPSGPSDQWGPGTRIPALIVAPGLNSDFVVDHIPHDTTSILATIEHRFTLAPLGTRDAAVRDLSSVYLAR